jgi:hypothetical protein
MFTFKLVPVDAPRRFWRKTRASGSTRRNREAAMTAAARRLIQAVKLLARDGRIPKPLRALAAFGLLPIPGPVDEAVLFIVGLLLLAFYRSPLREAWGQAAAPKYAQPH